MTNIKAIIKELCEITIANIPTDIKDINIEKIEKFNVDKFNKLSEKYKEYVLIHLMFYKKIYTKQRVEYNSIKLVINLFPEDFLHNIFKKYPDILNNIIEHAIKTKSDILNFIFQNKKNIYIDKVTYLYFENLALTYNSMDMICIINKYHIEDELFNNNDYDDNSDDISDDISDE